MIYLQNTKIIKDIEILQDLPQLETPVLSDIETGATITLGTELTASNIPTGAKLYVNGVEQASNTFTITPVATARNNGYNYTINLQYKGVSGYEDSEISSYTLKMKNPAPTVSLDSGVFTQSSKSITVTRQENVYEVEQDQRCIRGEYDSTSEGTWCNVLMLSDTSSICQFNFFIRETDYADRSDVITRYYHIAGSESMPQPTISYDENNENFTISVNNWPTDPVNGSYMSSDYTIYYSINDDTTINTQYNSIAVSCSAGDVIRAKVVSGAGFADSATVSYNIPVPTPEGMEMLNETFDNIDVSEDGYTDISSQLNNYTDNQGWTGSKVYTSPGGGVKIGSGTTAGNITSPDISMINTDATLTVTVNAKQWSNSSGTINNTLLVELIGSGTVDEEGANEFTLTDTAADYTVTFTNIETSTVKISITGGNRCYIYDVSAVSNEGSFEPTPEPEPSFNDSYTFSNGETDYASGDSVTIGNVGEYEMLFISDNGTCVTPDSTPTCSSDDTSVATITWSSDWGFDNLCGFTINAEAAGNTSVSMEMTIDGTTYNTTLEVIIPESFSDTYAFSDGGDEQYDDGGELGLTEGDTISLLVVEIESGDEVAPDSASASSDDDSVATATWDDNEGCFSIEAIAEGSTTLNFSIVIDGTEYTPTLSVTVTAAE